MKGKKMSLDYLDSDEIDDEVWEAVDLYNNGSLTYIELIDEVGQEMADLISKKNLEIEGLFDNPEEL